MSFGKRFSLTLQESTKRFLHNNILEPSLIKGANQPLSAALLTDLVCGLPVTSRITHDLLLQPSKLPSQPRHKVVIRTVPPSPRLGLASHKAEGERKVCVTFLPCNDTPVFCHTGGLMPHLSPGQQVSKPGLLSTVNLHLLLLKSQVATPSAGSTR